MYQNTMFFYLAVFGIGYYMYTKTYKAETVTENKSARDSQEGGVLLDVVRSLGSIGGVQNGTDEIIRTKFTRDTSDINQILDSVDNRKKKTVELSKKHLSWANDTQKRLVYVSPTDDYHFPNMTALSDWYPKAVGVTAPVLNPSLQTN